MSLSTRVPDPARGRLAAGAGVRLTRVRDGEEVTR
jgi:hypothetical protein